MEEFVAYHVVTGRPMELNQIILTNNNKSGVYARVMQREKDVLDVYAHPEKYVIENIDHHLLVAMRELAMEEVRQNNFPNLPSRLTSLYVSETLSEAEGWAYVFGNMGREVLQIVKLKVNGNKFVGDANNCFKASIDKSENLSYSFDYWQNKPNKINKPAIHEILVAGQIQVIEIIKDFRNK